MFGENPATAVAHYEEEAPVPGYRTPYANLLDDGNDPVTLGTQITRLLEGRGWRRTASDQWTSPLGVKATVSYGSGSYRLRFFPPGLKKGAPAEVLDLARMAHAERAVDALYRWDTWPECGAPVCSAA